MNKNKTSLRMCLVEDTKHWWYCIPLKMRKQFFKSMHCDLKDWEAEMAQFEEYKLTVPIASISFENIDLIPDVDIPF